MTSNDLEVVFKYISLLCVYYYNYVHPEQPLIIIFIERRTIYCVPANFPETASLGAGVSSKGQARF